MTAAGRDDASERDRERRAALGHLSDLVATDRARGHGLVTGGHGLTSDSEPTGPQVLDLLREDALTARSIADRSTVYALFTDPPPGRVGLTEAQAIAAGHRVLKATKPMRAISRAKEMGETQGFVKVLVDADTDRFLGASVLGVSGDEVINLFALAISAGLTTAQFQRVVLVHPTVSELMPWVLAGLESVAELEKVA